MPLLRNKILPLLRSQNTFGILLGMSKTILFFCDQHGDVALRKLAGICAFGRRKRWNIRFIPYLSGATSFQSYLQIWHPDGIISDNIAFATTKSSGIPTVFIDADGALGHRHWPSVLHDPRTAARLAAAEFARLGLNHFAYLPPAEEREWSDERLDAFRKATTRPVDVFQKKRQENVTACYLKRLKKWACALPKPCGVFAVNDATADILLSICPLVNVKVPQDLAIIGVDDVLAICESTFPPLTSIAPAFKDSGTMAAQLLDMLMSGHEPDTRTLLFGSIDITRRQSTRRLYGRATELRSTRDLIYRESCQGLKARDVFAIMKGSRRNAEIQFKATTGRTVLEEIKNVRLRQAKRLLQTTSLSLAEIATKCGYKSSSYLRKAFEKRMQMTMGAWRKAHRFKEAQRD